MPIYLLRAQQWRFRDKGLFTVSGIPTDNEAWLAWVMVASRSFAVVCRCVPANCDILQAKTFLFIVSPGIKLQEESVYSKADVICLYCERFAGKFDVDSCSRNRINTSPEKRRTV